MKIFAVTFSRMYITLGEVFSPPFLKRIYTDPATLTPSLHVIKCQDSRLGATAIKQKETTSPTEGPNS